MIPSTHPAKIDQVDNNNNNMGESNMIKEKVINNPSIEYLYFIPYNLVLNGA